MTWFCYLCRFFIQIPNKLLWFLTLYCGLFSRLFIFLPPFSKLFFELIQFIKVASLLHKLWPLTFWFSFSMNTLGPSVLLHVVFRWLSYAIKISLINLKFSNVFSWTLSNSSLFLIYIYIYIYKYIYIYIYIYMFFEILFNNKSFSFPWN